MVRKARLTPVRTILPTARLAAQEEPKHPLDASHQGAQTLEPDPMRTRLAVLIAVTALVAAACGDPSDTADSTTPGTTGSTTPPSTTEPNTPLASDASAALAGTRWVIVSFGIMGADDPVLPTTTPMLAFDVNGNAISGSTGCNSYFAAVITGTGSTISFGDIGMTEMACLDEGVMDQEQRFLDVLGRIGEFTFDGKVLVLEASNGSAVIRLVAEQAEPDRSFAGSWRLTTLIDGDIASSVIAGTEVTLEIDLNAMTVNGSGGCNGYGGPIEVEGDTPAPIIPGYGGSITPIRIGPLMSTMMACEEGIMNQEAAALGTLGDAVTATVKESFLTISTGDGRELVFEWAGE